jgi:alkanesulfonate monooxygenase SsuD/methylene tetrahydromethanopterin reductase-like flavin-dependent oxidoreductase (luciferase family)
VTTTDIQVGTVAAPEILRAPHRERREFLSRIRDAGLNHTFVADHVSFHIGAGMDGLINAATLTAIEPALNVVVGVYLLALRHPVPVARQLATIAESAPGQLILGVGVGGEDRNEVAMCGVDPATRGRRTDECLTVLRGLLSGEQMDHAGEFFEFEKGWIQPTPDPSIPIVIGGRSEAALRRTAQHGDGWLAAWVSPRRFAEAVGQVAEMAKPLGRNPTYHGLQLWVGIDDDVAHARARLAKGMHEFYRIPFERFEKTSPYGSVEAVADALAPYVDAGCRLFNLMPVAADPVTGIEAIGQIKRRLTGGA